ncbi:MAG: alkaline phosphatase [Pedobacter sp.]|nr:MAG: alkaline phosphatase [Pedobacter sp.]
MQRRKFLKRTALFSGLAAINPIDLLAKDVDSFKLQGKQAKNIIFMISDGMSTGTLAMADLYAKNTLGRTSHWMNLYQENKVSRALMDTASASSIVTDSAAASSAFGGGVRVRNGVLNIGANGEKYVPLWQKFKQKGKKAGCVTTVTITHATPAGFCINSDSRNAELEIAEMYAGLGFDVMMGGGDEFFNSKKRKDGKDLYQLYKQKGYQIIKDKDGLKKLNPEQKLLGVFCEGALPYAIDQSNSKELGNTPTLAEMTSVAIEQMKDHKDGFVLQVEAGKVDWAAHANDIAGLIHDQLAFDDAIQKVMEFAEKDGQTLVVITTDHGNANPGTIYGVDAGKKFDSISNYRYTNEHLLNSISPEFSFQKVKDLVNDFNKIVLTDIEAKKILEFYTGLEKEEGLYNYKKLPFKLYADMQQLRNNVGWISMDHSGDYVELAMYGPGSEMLKPFLKNTDLHQLVSKVGGLS